MAEVTLKSTKQEIYDALQAAKAELARKNEIMETPADKAAKEEKKKVLETAEQDVKSNMFSAEMNEKYENLKKAIAIMEDRLKEMCNIEEEYQSFVLLVNAQKSAQLNLEKETERRRAEIQEDLDKAHIAAKEEKEKIAAERQREQEEYEYNLKRERQREQDEYQDKVAQAEKLLAETKAAAESYEAEMDEKKDHIRELEEQVAALPEKLQEKYDEGYANGEKDAGKDYGYKKSMADKDHEYQIREKDNEIRRLEDTVDSQARKIESLEGKLDAAYAQIQTLATKTVESNGSIKVISGNSDNGNKR